MTAPQNSDLKDRVTIQRPIRVANGQGGYATDWADIEGVASVSAKLVGLSGAETLNSTVLRSVSRWRVIIRRRAAVTTAHRLMWDGLAMNIVSALPHPDSPRRFTVLICETGLSADGS
jgi:SPP1 family predicted phage head-tail adaptor